MTQVNGSSLQQYSLELNHQAWEFERMAREYHYSSWSGARGGNEKFSVCWTLNKEECKELRDYFRGYGQFFQAVAAMDETGVDVSEIKDMMIYEGDCPFEFGEQWQIRLEQDFVAGVAHD